ncbi:MAG: TonB-dependent receptor plug domain-containing protein [Gammaproteobacteria bacterium]
MTLLPGLLPTGPACAVDDDDHLDVYFMEEAPLVLTASRLSQPLAEAPVAITVIDKAMIKASGAREIAELFRLVPGMQIGYVDGSSPVATYHGMASQYANRMQILVDGASIYNPLFGGILWENFPLLIEDIERIEVVRGPNSSSYGPNSFLGVINITTTPAAQTNGLSSSFRGGNRNYQRAFARYGDSVGDMDYRLSFAHKNSSGLNGIRDDFNTETVSGRVDYRLSPNDVILYNFGYSQGPREIDYNTILEGRFQRTRHDRSAYQHLRWERHLNQDEFFALQFSYNHNKNEDDYRLDFGGQSFPIDQGQQYDSFDLEFQHNVKPFRKTRLAWGAGARYNQVSSPYDFNTGSDITGTKTRVFGNLEWRPFDKWIVNLGALYEFNDSLNKKNDLSGRFAINYLFVRDHALRFTASRDSHAPTLAASNLDVVLKNNIVSLPLIRADNDIEHEEAYTLEVGYHGDFFNRNLSADFKLFHQNFHGLLGLKGIDPATGAFIFGNSSKATAEGYELQLDYRPSPRTLLHFGYSHIQIDTDNPAEGFQNSAPDDSFNVLLSQFLDNQWRVGAAYYYRSGMEFLGLTNPLGPYKRLDLMVEKSFQPWSGGKLTISANQQFALDDNQVFDDRRTFDSRTFFEIHYSYE